MVGPQESAPVINAIHFRQTIFLSPVFTLWKPELAVRHQNHGQSRIPRIGLSRSTPNQLLKKAMLDFQIERMHEAVDKAWEERGYTQETMDGWLKEHMRTPYGPEKKVESAS